MSQVLPAANQTHLNEAKILSGFGRKILLIFINEEFFQDKAYNNQIRVVSTVLTCLPLSFIFLAGAFANMRSSMLSSWASLLGFVCCTNLLSQMRFNSFLRVPHSDLARRLVKIGNTTVACFLFAVVATNFETGAIGHLAQLLAAAAVPLAAVLTGSLPSVTAWGAVVAVFQITVGVLWKMQFQWAKPLGINAEQADELGNRMFTNLVAHFLFDVLALVFLMQEQIFFRLSEDDLRNLKSANEETLQALEMQKQFIAKMSHELRTPLTHISAYIELLLKDSLAAEQRKMLQTIQMSSNCLRKLFNDALDFCKVQEDKFSLESVQLSLHDLCFDVLKTVMPQVDSKNVEVVGFISKLVPIVLIGDPVRLRQILFTLCSNLATCMKSGDLSIRIETVQPSAQKPFDDVRPIAESQSDVESHVLSKQHWTSFSFKRTESKDNFFDMHSHGSEQSLQSATLSDPSLYSRLLFSVSYVDTAVAKNGNADLLDNTQNFGSDMYMAQRLVKKMGGQLMMHHIDKGNGIRFRFSVLLRIPPELPTSLDPRKELNLETCRVALSCKGALQSIAKESLLEYGFEVPEEAIFSSSGSIDPYMKFPDISKPDVLVIDLDKRETMRYFADSVNAYEVAGSSRSTNKYRRTRSSSMILETIQQNYPLLKVVAVVKNMPETARVPNLIFLSKPVVSLSIINAVRDLYIRDDQKKRKSSSIVRSMDSGCIYAANNSLKLRVLYVDDNLINCKVMAKMIESCGHECERTDLPIQALNLLKKRNLEGTESDRSEAGSAFDALFTDVMMPEMDGYELTERIREIERENSHNLQRHLPIVGVTANVTKESQEACFQHGMDLVMMKPYTQNDVRSALSQIPGLW